MSGFAPLHLCLALALVWGPAPLLAGPPAASPPSSPGAERTREDPERLAVFELHGPEGLPSALLQHLADRIRGILLELPAARYTVLTRDSLTEQIVDGRAAPECVDDCEITLARTLGAQVVVTGAIEAVGEGFGLTLSVHETARGRLLHRATAQASGVDALGEIVDGAARSLRDQLSPPPAPAPTGPPHLSLRLPEGTPWRIEPAPVELPPSPEPQRPEDPYRSAPAVPVALPALPPGDYTLFAGGPCDAPVRMPFRLVEGEHRHLDLASIPLARRPLRVEVRDGAGRPHPGRIVVDRRSLGEATATLDVPRCGRELWIVHDEEVWFGPLPSQLFETSAEALVGRTLRVDLPGVGVMNEVDALGVFSLIGVAASFGFGYVAGVNESRNAAFAAAISASLAGILGLTWWMLDAAQADRQAAVITLVD